MLPVCVVIASVAMFSGISGAALLTPVFLIGFPLLGVPQLSTVAAIGTALLLETSGFGAGVARYLSMRLVDTRTAWSIVAVTLPVGATGATGAIAAAHAPAQALRVGYGILMIGLAAVLARKATGRPADEPAAAQPWSPDRTALTRRAAAAGNAGSPPPPDAPTSTARMGWDCSGCCPGPARSLPA